MVVAGVAGITAASLSDPETSSDNVVRTINWYDFNYAYRKPITITNSGSALTDYELSVTVDTAALVSAGKMQADGDDIRFTTSDGVTEASYFLESGMDTSGTVIWVKVPSIAATPTSTTIYMYYGYSSATAVSDGDGVFIYFNDFEVAADLDDWTEVDGANGTPSRVTSPAQHGSYSLLIDDTNSGNNKYYGLYTNFTSQASCVIEYYAQPAQTNAAWEIQALSGTTIGPYLQFSSGGNIQYNSSGSWTDFSTPLTYSSGTWYSFKLNEVRVDNDTYDVYVNSSLMRDNTAFRNALTGVDRLEFYASTNRTDPNIYVDLVKVRQYTANTVSPSLGSEEPL